MFDMKKKIAVFGLANIETNLKIKGFPLEYYPIDYCFFGINSSVAGVGFNIAKALKTLGDDAEIITYTGDDAEGRRVIKTLKDEGIRSDHVLTSLKNTPVSVILFDPEGRRQIYCDLKDIQDQRISPESVKEIIKNADAAVLCNINFNRELIKYAHSRGVLTATDVHVLGNIDDEYNKDFMENADILFLSDEHLPCAADKFIVQLHERYHNKVIVIGMGSKGAMLFDSVSGKVINVPAYVTGNVVNTVGAGDSLFSSFLHFYIKGMSAEDALRRAVIFAGIKIGSNGAAQGFSNEDEIEALV